VRARIATGTVVMIAGDYGGEPHEYGLSRTWFNRTLWDACGKSIKKRRALIAQVLEHENDAEPARLGYVGTL
jgi:hypothetical protein